MAADPTRPPHQPTRWAAKDRAGNTWVSQTTGPKVYNARGDLILDLGQAHAAEFGFAMAGPILEAANGDIFAMDPTLRKVAHYTSELALARTYDLPGYVEEALMLSNGDVLVNMRVQSAELLGVPFHILRNWEIVDSFGYDSASVQGFSELRRLALHPDGRIVMGYFNKYEVEFRDPEGEQSAGVRRVGLWEPPINPSTLTLENPPPPHLSDIRVDSAGRLWTISWLTKPGWNDGLLEGWLPNGRLYAYAPQGNQALYRSIIEVLAPDLNTVLARWEVDAGLPYGFLDDHHIFGNAFTEEGVPQFVVWEMDLSLAQGG